MKVSELIEQLKELPQDFEVVQSKDGEGNEFSPLADVSTAMYVADSTWSGELRDEEEMEDEEYKENAIVFWPTN
jgi:hypothetical protein